MLRNNYRSWLWDAHPGLHFLADEPFLGGRLCLPAPQTSASDLPSPFSLYTSYLSFPSGRWVRWSQVSPSGDNAVGKQETEV